MMMVRDGREGGRGNKEGREERSTDRYTHHLDGHEHMHIKVVVNM